MNTLKKYFLSFAMIASIILSIAMGYSSVFLNTLAAISVGLVFTVVCVAAIIFSIVLYLCRSGEEFTVDEEHRASLTSAIKISKNPIGLILSLSFYGLCLFWLIGSGWLFAEIVAALFFIVLVVFYPSFYGYLGIAEDALKKMTK